MSKYTTTIKNLKKNNFDFGLTDYPIFNDSYRNKLNNKILNHYYMSEIAFETAELFKFYLNNKMNEIMPYYNTLYEKQETVLLNLFKDTDMTETLTRTLNGTNTSTTTSESTNESENTTTSNNVNKYHNTPQGRIDYSDIESGKWLTEITLNDTNNRSNNSSEDNSTLDTEATSRNTETYTKNLSGTNQSYIDTLLKIRQNLMNIDMLIINDLEELFFGIF